MTVLLTLASILDKATDYFHFSNATINTRTDIALHNHNYAEIFWIKEGYGTHLINGKELQLQPGSIWMIRPEDTHTFYPHGTKNSLVVSNVAFPIESLDLYRKRYFKNSTSYFWINSHIPYHTQLPHQTLTEIISLGDRLIKKAKTSMQLDMFILSLFNILNPSREQPANMPHWLSYALEHYNTPENFRGGINSFVKLCGRSKDHVNRTTQKTLNQTLTDLVNHAKLEYAKQQLSQTNDSIKTICYNCGLSSSAYFHRLFKKSFEMSPSQYRKLHNRIL